MARPTEGQLEDLGPWVRGLNNLSEEARLSYESLRAAVNVDITDTGGVRRRLGYSRIVAGSACRSLWSNKHQAFFADGGNFYALDDTGATTLKLNTIHPLNRLAYCAIEPYVYMSDSVNGYRIAPDGSIAHWSVPSPARQPDLTAGANGGYDAGRYMVAITYVNAAGIESGTDAAAVVDVAKNGSITLSNFPASPFDAERIRVYVSKPNGTELLFHSAAPVGVSTILLYRHPLGRKLTTMHKSELPAGQHLGYFQGRMFSSVANILYWSEPMNYGLTDLEFNHLVVSSDITMVAGLPEGAGGMYLGTQHRTLFLNGNDPSKFELVEAYPYGVVPGSLTYIAASMLGMENDSFSLPVWMANNGTFCVGMQNGKIVPVNEAVFAAKKADRAAAMFRTQRGVPQFVVSASGASEGGFAISDSASVTVRRNGIEV